MPTPRLIAVDCETDKFVHGRIPRPFIWGAFDANGFRHWRKTEDFMAWLSEQSAVAYAHNGGKFDYFFLFKYIKRTRARIINGRLAELTIGKCRLRDSYSIIPVALEQIQKGKINYDLMEADKREEYMESHIIPYLREDCEVLYNTVKTYRATAGKALTIASNALASSRKLGSDPGRTNYRFDREFREYYHGGRVECFQPGTHRDVTTLDIVSSYPYVMKQFHPTGIRRTAHDNLDYLKDDEIGRSFIKLKCFSAGAFPIKSDDGYLNFPHDYNEYAVTGWEYNVAKKHGLIHDVEFVRVTTFENKLTFAPYIDKWFSYKNSFDKKTNPIEYTIGKIMQNSLYGKCSQNPLKYHDYIIVDPYTPINYDEGWEFFCRFEDIELHRRPTSWNYQYKYGVDWVKRPLFYNVATGASITGMARARLLDAAHSVGIRNVIYCDTDSLSVKPCDLSKIPMGDGLGDWQIEGEHGVGHFAGKKLYGVKFPDQEKPKIASKGSKLDYEQIRRIVNGEIVVWENPAPTFSLARGVHFVTREISATSIQKKGLLHA